jgi:hypothetical protein
VTSLYERELPRCFPWVVDVTPSQAGALLAWLTQARRPDGARGSSFAVTVEGPGRWRLWLSDAGWRHLAHRSPPGYLARHGVDRARNTADMRLRSRADLTARIRDGTNDPLGEGQGPMTKETT